MFNNPMIILFYYFLPKCRSYQYKYNYTCRYSSFYFIIDSFSLLLFCLIESVLAIEYDTFSVNILHTFNIGIENHVKASISQ